MIARGYEIIIFNKKIGSRLQASGARPMKLIQIIIKSR
jgi:hypothetical protein